MDGGRSGYAQVTSDVISLTLPAHRRFFQVARLVVGALATRFALSYEQLDDLQLAIETVLRDNVRPGSAVTLEIVVRADRLELSLGPVEAAPPGAGEDEAQLTTRRVLGALVERVELVQRDGSQWIRLEEPVAGDHAPLGAS